MDFFITRRNLCDLMPQHADSEGALSADMRPLEATSSVNSLGSSDSERPALEEDCLEHFIPSDSEDPACSVPSVKSRLIQEQETEGEGSESDDILMEDTQVADFASSMLAAISCWHYRAKALLSMGFPTVRFFTTKGIVLILLPDLLHACRTSRHIACAVKPLTTLTL